MTKLEKLEAEIKKLSIDEMRQLSDTLAELQADLWDEQLARDCDAGKLDALIEEAKKDIAANQVKPL